MWFVINSEIYIIHGFKTAKLGAYGGWVFLATHRVPASDRVNLNNITIEESYLFVVKVGVSSLKTTHAIAVLRVIIFF